MAGNEKALSVEEEKAKKDKNGVKAKGHKAASDISYDINSLLRLLRGVGAGRPGWVSGRMAWTPDHRRAVVKEAVKRGLVRVSGEKFSSMYLITHRGKTWNQKDRA